MSKTTKDLEFLITQNFNNLADIPDNEDLVIKYLLHRCEQGKVYTWVGPVLLAINPRRINSDLYDHTHRDYFSKVSSVSQRAVIKPHVFAVATTARYRLTHGLGKVQQVIIISGDSGSGKTFSASKILGFLAATNQSLTTKNTHPYTLSKIEKACAVISAFSTASTERNKYSSRHGQLVRLQYLNASIQGAVLTSFLFEQSRITSGCNNFHIFGQILAGLSESELETLKLSRTTFYKITNIDLSIKHEDRIEGFQDTVEAMNSLGLGAKQRKDIFKVVALLVHLGNIQFKEQGAAGCDVDVYRKDSADALESACSLITLPIPDLVKLLTTNLIRPRSRLQRHSSYRSAITSTEACNARLHSIIRYLYHRLFNWLVNRLNEILTCKAESPRLLGILDIFGIEFFSENSIEQLSINYANERMQLHFMQKYLEAGRSELEGEGLTTLPPPPISDIYEQRLAAIECGLFPVLNDACLVARIEEHSSLNHLALSPRDGNERFIRNRGETFTVSHYSCLVEYRTADILRKNTDKVPAELLSTFSPCQNKFILSLLHNDDERPAVDKRKNTMLAKSKQSMDALIKELDNYDLHYVRCMKPVDRMNDPEMIKEFKEQLACSGILDALPLARCTLPIRLKYDEFSKRYSRHAIVDHEIGDLTHVCKTILKRVLNEEDFQSLVHFGSRLIFLTEAVLYKLESMRNEFRSQCALKIQSAWQKYKKKMRSKIPESSTRNFDPEDIEAAQGRSVLAIEKSFSCTDSRSFKIHIETSKELDDCDSAVLSTRQRKRETLARSYSNGGCKHYYKNSELETANESRPTKLTQDVQDFSRSSHFLADLNDRKLFYRNRILSRRRLAVIPVRFHTRLTCLPDSHRLPRSELPGGLGDCL